MLERMEKQGLIRRVQSDDDKRKTLLYLTEIAKSLRDEAEIVSRQMNDVFYKGFNSDEIEQFEAYLDRVRNNLEEWRET